MLQKPSLGPYVHCSVFYNSQDVEAAQVPISRQVGKQLWNIHIKEYYLIIERKRILPFVTAWRDLENMMQLAFRERQVHHLTLWNLMNKQAQRQTHGQKAG